MRNFTNARSIIRMYNVPDIIDSFDFDYAFLSNFFPSPIIYRGCLYTTVEHAYQAQKGLYCLDKKEARPYMEAIAKCPSPNDSKKLGRKVSINVVEWDRAKRDVMRNALDLKFEIPALRKLLLNTGDSKLIEGNYWGDTYWGICKGKGMNYLGKMLMSIRSELEED